ncbi:M1 family peptidase, partial [Salinimicrobium sp. CDJ15-91]|nr:M1 family peptidase [Salinimicrobium oceani]
EEYNESMKGKTPAENAPTLNEYLMDNFTPQQRAEMKMPKYFYQVTFNKPGGLVMPIIVEYTYADGTSEKVTYPVQIWRKNDNQVSRALATDKEITKIVVDPDLETADVDTSNNSWPQAAKADKFQEFKERTQG